MRRSSTALALMRMAYTTCSPSRYAVDLRHRECGIRPEVHRDIRAAVAVHDRLEHGSPLMGARHVALLQHRPFEITQVVEAEHRVVAGLGKVTVVGRAFLLTVGRPAQPQRRGSA